MMGTLVIVLAVFTDVSVNVCVSAAGIPLPRKVVLNGDNLEREGDGGPRGGRPRPSWGET